MREPVTHFELTDAYAACGRALPTAGFFTPSETDFARRGRRSHAVVVVMKAGDVRRAVAATVREMADKERARKAALPTCHSCGAILYVGDDGLECGACGETVAWSTRERPGRRGER